MEIRVDHALKKYGTNIVLDNVSLQLKSGKIYGLVGRNGSGKTMLLRAICGFIQLDSGNVKINGETVKQNFLKNVQMGVMIESPGFLMEYSGYRNLLLLAKIQGKIGKKEVCQALEMVGLDPKLKKHVSKYSLGMRQRLGIAQALMENPDILLLDEPMNGLDNEGVEEVRQLLLACKEQGKLILLASHTKEDIDLLCDEVFRMEHGKISIEK